MPAIEVVLQEYMNNMRNLNRAQPLRLGGTSSAGGGSGGPPGGFIGVLPQTRIAYDTSELATNLTTASGTLLDNLNHIRYRLETLEGATTVVNHNDLDNIQGGTTDEYYHLTSSQYADLETALSGVSIGTLDITQDDTPIATNVTVIDIVGATVSEITNGARITISGGGGSITVQEDGTSVNEDVTIIDFVGASVSQITNGVQVTISGGTSSGGVDILAVQIFT